MALTKVTGQVINDSTGLVVGVTTVGGGLSATDGFFSGIVTAVGDASFSGSVSVGGTLTYEDVTNIDSVGLVTARNGIVVGSGITLSKDGDIFATGITTISENLKVGTGVTISPDGDGFFTGVVTATSYAGDGSNLTGISAGTALSGSTDNTVCTVTGANAIQGEANLTFDGSTLGVSGNLDLAADGDTIILGTGDDFQISFDGTNGVIKGVAGVQNVNIWTENVAKYQFTSGALRPLTNDSYDLGDSSLRWRNIYTNDLNLSNEGGKNDVDGTWGNYTIQEGESDLFLINNRTGKKYKFNLTEVL